MRPEGTSVHILVVEDDANEVLFIKRAFDRLGIACQISFAINGSEAIELLSAACDPSWSGEVPTHIMLDLKLPKTSGIDVLHWLRRHPRLCQIPVAVFSSSRLESDLTLAKSLGVDGLWEKPLGYAAFLAVVGDIARSWGLLPTPLPRMKDYSPLDSAK